MGLMQLAAGRGKFSHQCYFEARCSGSGKLLTGAGGKNKGNHIQEQSERRIKKRDTVKHVVDK